MEINREEMRKRLATGAFVENNGVVLRTINILRHRYNKLTTIKYALPQLAEDQFMDCLNFLQEEGYIHLRSVETQAEVQLADVLHYSELEAKLTGKGIRLLAQETKDPLIRV